MSIAEEDISYYNPQSCDCSEIFNIANGVPVAIRFIFQSRFLYVFAFDLGLTVTKSKSELFSEMFENEKNSKSVLFDEDDSILFDCGLLKQGCPWLLNLLLKEE